MPTIRVDAYPGLLSSVQVRLTGAPFTILETVLAAGITEPAPGVYQVVTTQTGNWMLVLLDSAGGGLGVKYANPDNLHAKDFPPWLEVDPSGNGSESVTITIRKTTGQTVAGAEVYITEDAAGSKVVIDELISNDNGKVYARLNPGTWYVWATKAGTSITNPTPINVVDV